MADQEIVAKRVPGTSALVDGFRFQSPEFGIYFLTHAHSDHTTGLTRAFSAGTIYCSPVTASLILRDSPRVRDESRVVALEVGRTHSIADPRCGGFEVTLVCANHCPGACVLVFDVPVAGEGGEKAEKKKRRIVHTGDFRFCPRLHGSHPLLRSASSSLPVDVLMLDTTYAHPRHDHPPQEMCVRACAEFVRRETARSLPSSSSCSVPLLPPPLFVFGSYRIGKERLYLGVAEELGERVWVPPQKRRLLELMGLLRDDGEDDDGVDVKSDVGDDGRESRHRRRRYPRSMLASHPSQARLHVAPMGASLTPPALLSRIQSWGSGGGSGGNGSSGGGNGSGGGGSGAPPPSSAPPCPWGRVVGIRPTGWTWRRPKKRKDGGEEGEDLASLVSSYSPLPLVVVAGVPYSEHSSFPELRAAVSAMRPARVVPTVTGGTAGDRGAISRRFEDLLDRKRDRSRLDYFFSSAPRPSRPATEEESKEGERGRGEAAALAAAAASDVVRVKEEEGSDGGGGDDIDGDGGDVALSWGPEVGGDDWTLEEEEEGEDDEEKRERKAPPPLPPPVPFDLSSVDEDEQRRILAEIQATTERERLLREERSGKRKRRQPTLREALFGGGSGGGKKNK